MGAWNQPIIVPRNPGIFEQNLPSLLNIVGNAYLQKKSQAFQEQQLQLANKRQDQQTYNEMIASGGWEPVSPWDINNNKIGPNSLVDVGGRKLKPAPLTFTPVTGPDGKPIKGQLFMQGNGMQKQIINVPAGWNAFKVMTDNDPIGLPVGTAYLQNDQTGEIKKLYEPPEPPSVSAEREYQNERARRRAKVDQPIPGENVETFRETSGEGDVTIGAFDKDTGQPLYQRTIPGIGRPGKTSEPAIINREVTTAVEKQRQIPGKLYSAAQDSLKNSLSLKQQTALDMAGYYYTDTEGSVLSEEKAVNTPGARKVTRDELIIKEMGLQANIKEKYPDAVYGVDKNGEWAWAVQRNGQWIKVLDKFGMKGVE